MYDTGDLDYETFALIFLDTDLFELLSAEITLMNLFNQGSFLYS